MALLEAALKTQRPARPHRCHPRPSAQIQAEKQTVIERSGERPKLAVWKIWGVWMTETRLSSQNRVESPGSKIVTYPLSLKFDI